jgi:uncharacterized cofD-like protein
MKPGPLANPDETTRAAPERVVAVGGGTGLPAVLRGLRLLVKGEATRSVTAVVAMSDDGGSSGRLRRTMGLPPPGDVRNCLVALAEEETLLGSLFQHRYGRSELEGHSVGNLILAALAEQTGSFLKAVEMSSRVLRTVGRILPATEDDVRLEATLEDGARVAGETNVAAVDRRIRRISLVPNGAAPAPGVVKSILEADLVVLGPGSLYTSILPNLAVRGIAEALRQTDAAVILVANLVSERGEASGMDLADHLEVIEGHAGDRIVDGVLVNDGPVEGETLRRYRAEGATPLRWNGTCRPRLHVERRFLLAPGSKLRHDPDATAEGLVRAWGAVKKVGARNERS